MNATSPDPGGRDEEAARLEFARHAMALLADADATLEIEPLAGDGSARRIYRARLAGLSAILVANPPPPEGPRPDENEGFLAVREFLDQRGVRVPAFYVADLASGLLLLEDLGDERLHDRVRRAGWGAPEGLSELYRSAIRHLVRMQAPHSPAFDMTLVSNPPYTEEFVLRQEARYFHEEMVRGLARRADDFAAVESECRALARLALGAPARVFMHLDYQSRNLMLTGPDVAVIDFQGARLGPPEYDLAALLFDPYADMPGRVREALVLAYLEDAAAAGVPGIDAEPTEAWRRRFHANAANRLMQALGAFAKLGGRMGRPGFLEHVPAGLRGLSGTLRRLGDFPALEALTRGLGPGA
jgi:aminoglycoside/choline kinase family phosphotransferase